MGLRITSCTPAELAVLNESWPIPDDLHRVFTETPNSNYLIAWDGTQPRGSGLLRWDGPGQPNAKAAFPLVPELTQLHVREQHRGRGVGTAIIMAAEALATARDRSCLSLGVDADNTGAARLYERLGYRRSGVRDVVSYGWTDQLGQRHHSTETSELLVKHW